MNTNDLPNDMREIETGLIDGTIREIGCGRYEYVREQQDASPTFHRIRSADGQLIDHRPAAEGGSY